MSFDNFAFVKARGYPVTYVVDCGSQHTEVGSMPRPTWTAQRSASRGRHVSRVASPAEVLSVSW